MESTTVMQRVAQGERLVLDSSYSYQSRFSNGDTVPHQIMSHLVDVGAFLATPSRGNVWVANEQVALDR